jgi:hypothetical protein
VLTSAHRASGTRPPGEGRRGSLTLAPSSSPPSSVEPKRTQRRRRVAALLVLLGLGAAIDGAITWRAAKKSIPDWTRCPTAFVSRGAVDGVLPAQGVLTLADTVRIGSPLAGQVVTVIASPGQDPRSCAHPISRGHHSRPRSARLFRRSPRRGRLRVTRCSSTSRTNLARSRPEWRPASICLSPAPLTRCAFQ